MDAKQPPFALDEKHLLLEQNMNNDAPFNNKKALEEPKSEMADIEFGRYNARLKFYLVFCILWHVGLVLFWFYVKCFYAAVFLYSAPNHGHMFTPAEYRISSIVITALHVAISTWSLGIYDLCCCLIHHFRKGMSKQVTHEPYVLCIELPLGYMFWLVGFMVFVLSPHRGSIWDALVFASASPAKELLDLAAWEWPVKFSQAIFSSDGR